MPAVRYTRIMARRERKAAEPYHDASCAVLAHDAAAPLLGSHSEGALPQNSVSRIEPQQAAGDSPAVRVRKIKIRCGDHISTLIGPILPPSPPEPVVMTSLPPQNTPEHRRAMRAMEHSFGEVDGVVNAGAAGEGSPRHATPSKPRITFRSRERQAEYLSTVMARTNGPNSSPAMRLPCIKASTSPTPFLPASAASSLPPAGPANVQRWVSSISFPDGSVRPYYLAGVRTRRGGRFYIGDTELEPGSRWLRVEGQTGPQSDESAWCQFLSLQLNNSNR